MSEEKKSAVAPGTLGIPSTPMAPPIAATSRIIPAAPQAPLIHLRHTNGGPARMQVRKEEAAAKLEATGRWQRYDPTATKLPPITPRFPKAETAPSKETTDRKQE